MITPGTLFTEIFVSNEHTATLEIRPIPTEHMPHTWLYQVTEFSPEVQFHGTISWSGDNPLELINEVLSDYRDHAIERDKRPV